jgi:hypothetical protein
MGVLLVRYRLVNQEDPNQTIGLVNQTWYGILEVAQKYGWIPMGTSLSGEYFDVYPLEEILNGVYDSPSPWRGSYASEEPRLVSMDDALNLADALDRAFLAYDPRVHALKHEADRIGQFERPLRGWPSIGAMVLVVEFCRNGAFWIEKF